MYKKMRQRLSICETNLPTGPCLHCHHAVISLSLSNFGGKAEMFHCTHSDVRRVSIIKSPLVSKLKQVRVVYTTTYCRVQLWREKNTVLLWQYSLSATVGVLIEVLVSESSEYCKYYTWVQRTTKLGAIREQKKMIIYIDRAEMRVLVRCRREMVG